MDKKYLQFIKELKQNIIISRYIAARLANKEQLLLYYITGKSLSEKIASEKWGAKVLEQIAFDLEKQLPGLKGFSHRNLKNMRQFFEAYHNTPIGQSVTARLNSSTNQLLTDPPTTAKSTIKIIGQSTTAQLEYADFFGISFTHHILLLNKCKGLGERLFYISQAASQFWTVLILEHHINANLFVHQGKLSNNFNGALPENLKASALQVFQDEYLFDFIHLDEESDERVFESQLVSNIKNSIMALGKGFSFIGNQYRIEVDGQEFYIDLLFYNRYLQCLVAFELKRGKFKPEYAGQLNFYLNVLDEKVKLPHENSSIGIILCKEKSNTVVEFAFKNISKALGAATFKTSKKVPKGMRGILPNADDLAQLL